MALRYLQSVAARRRDDEAVARGLNVGKEIGSLMSGLAGAIKSAKQDAAANKLMNTENAPRAALVSPGGQTVTTTSGSGDTSGPTQDLGQLPPDTSTFTNPATGNIEPLQGQGSSDADLASAMAASRLGSGPSVSSVSGQGTGVPSDADLQAAMAASSLKAAPHTTTSFVPNTIPAGVSTAGTKPFSGGVEGMKLQQEFQKSQVANQIQKLNLARAQRDAASAQAEDAGTGRFAIDAAIKRAQLAKIQAEIAAKGAPKSDKEEKNPPAVNINEEPVIDQGQLSKHIDGIYGKETSAGINRFAASSDGSIPKDADGNPLPSVSVPVGAGQKVVPIPVPELQTYVKQQNALRLKQGLPLFKVPGEDQSVGTSPDNPYIAKNNLEVYSRAPGTWIRLPPTAKSPKGDLAQVPERRKRQ